MSNSGKSAVGPAEYRLTLSSRPSSTSCFPALLTLLSQVSVSTSLPQLSHSISFFHARIPAHVVRLSQSCASDTSDPAPSVPPIASNFCISGMHQLDACTGCSCKKCLPMLKCLLCALMHDCVYCHASFCASSICSFVPFSPGSSNVRKDMHGALPIKSSVWCFCCTPISLDHLSFRGPRTVRRHVLLSCQ